MRRSILYRQVAINGGLTKKKELFTITPSTGICRGGKNQLFDLFSQPLKDLKGWII